MTFISTTRNDNDAALEHIKQRQRLLEPRLEIRLSPRYPRALAAVYTDLVLAKIGKNDFNETDIMCLLDKSENIRRNLRCFEEKDLFSVRRNRGLFYLHGAQFTSTEQWLQKAKFEFEQALKTNRQSDGDKPSAR